MKLNARIARDLIDLDARCNALGIAGVVRQPGVRAVPADWMRPAAPAAWIVQALADVDRRAQVKAQAA